MDQKVVVLLVVVVIIIIVFIVMYSSLKKKGDADDCARGRYINASGQCVACPDGQVSTGFDSTSCSLCPGGVTKHLGATGCAP